MKDKRRRGKKSGKQLGGPRLSGKPNGMKSGAKGASSKHNPSLTCKICDHNSQLCRCQEQMRSSLERILSSKFNQIFLEFGFNFGAELKELREKLNASANNQNSVLEIVKEAYRLFSSFVTTFAFRKGKADVDDTYGELIQGMYGTEFTVQELYEVAKSLQERTEALLEKYKRKDANDNSFVDKVWEHLVNQFPHQDLKYHRGKFDKIIRSTLQSSILTENESSIYIASKVISEVLAIGLDNIDDSTDENLANPPQTTEWSPLAAPEEGKFHDFDCPGINHYYVATSQYFRKLLQQQNLSVRKPIENKHDSVQSVEHIRNDKTLQNYNTKKLEFKEAGKVNTEKKVREMLLFHGTDAANIDSILKASFNLDFNPKHKKKMQLYGRGIYMAEHPELAFQYGNIILVCKVVNM